MTNLLKQKAQKARKGDVKRGTVLQAKRVARGLFALDTEKCLVDMPACASHSGEDTEARRRVWRVVGVRVGLPCHDMEVEGVVAKDDAVLKLYFLGSENSD
jgi:hypothetical protein